MFVRIVRRFGQRRTVQRLLSLALCLTALWAVTVPALAAESVPAKASRELTYLGRSGQLPPRSEMPTPSAGEPEVPPARAPSTQPPASSEDIPALPAGEDDWMLLLVNRDTPLPDSFSPPALESVDRGQQVDGRIADALNRMLSDARAAGLRPIVCSAYRTEAKQTQLYERKVRYYQGQGYGRTRAAEKAAFWVARPGTSEHQAGLAVDIISNEYQVLDAGQEKTAVQQWLMAHCAEYGFILRYPTDKSAVTNVGYEPWHYRYVGASAAQAMTEAGLCLEEYLAGN